MLAPHLAFINVDFATWSSEAGLADAREKGDAVDTGAVVLARIRLAFVDIDVAVFTGKAGSTDALVAVDQVVAAAVVKARVR